MRPRKLTLLAAFFFLLPAASAFGYMIGEQAATAAPGERVSFMWYVFGDPPFHAANVSTPAGWTAAVSPETMTADSPHRYRGTDDGYQKLYRMQLTVTVPTTSPPSTYTVTPTITASAQQSPGSVGVRHVQPIPFTVTVSGMPVEREKNEETEQETPPHDNTSSDTMTDSQEPSAPTGRAADGAPASADGIPWWAVALLAFQAVWIAAVIRLRR